MVKSQTGEENKMNKGFKMFAVMALLICAMFITPLKVEAKTVQFTDSLAKGIEKAVAGNHVGDISHAVQSHAERHRYGVVRDFVGHGIGRSMHEDPQVPNYGTKGKGPEIRPGMVICIEPMITMGTHKVRVLEDNWTAVTMDRKPAAHFEHTIAITEHGTEILTMRDTPRLIQ